MLRVTPEKGGCVILKALCQGSAWAAFRMHSSLAFEASD